MKTNSKLSVKKLNQLIKEAKEKVSNLNVSATSADSIYFDFFSEQRGDGDDGGWRVVLPSEELIGELVKDESHELFDKYKDYSERYGDYERDIQDFIYSEIETDLEPMMNFLWPLCKSRFEDVEKMADELFKIGRAVTLVEKGDHLYLALTGGGMDLSDHLILAYVACGFLPPSQLRPQIYSELDADTILQIEAVLKSNEFVKFVAERNIETVRGYYKN